MEHADRERLRRALFEELRREIADEQVLEAMARVPREFFVPPDSLDLAYANQPLPIGSGQTISQPLIVALMTQALRLTPGSRVLDVGTGSGYQTAVLAELAKEVVTVERLPDLLHLAQRRLGALGYRNIMFREAGPVLGCPDLAPYDAILVAAAAPSVPTTLVEQLVQGGRLVLPVGSLYEQELVLVVRETEGTRREALGACRFVPLVGPGAWEDQG
ncbi:MAG: protein-L-isoaspartate(D-aspartate) O-methyltransferase [Chloroflexi bacterium]|nr:protein-L-isoaspartate(D-aspartate) O-methyltransferase [Chloroflexota bacterium]